MPSEVLITFAALTISMRFEPSSIAIAHLPAWLSGRDHRQGTPKQNGMGRRRGEQGLRLRLLGNEVLTIIVLQNGKRKRQDDNTRLDCRPCIHLRLRSQLWLEVAGGLTARFPARAIGV